MKTLLKNKRKIIIFGCGNTAKQFYKEYSNKLNIDCFMSNTGEKEFLPDETKSYEVLSPIPKYKVANNKLIIICSVAIKEISDQLIMLGYVPFEDFIDFEIINLLFSKKKIALLYGACHLRGVRDALSCCPEYSQNYETYYIPNYLAVDIYTNQLLIFLAHNCDLFIYGHSIEKNDYAKNKYLISSLKENTPTLSIPLIYWGAYFPQIKRPFNRMNAYAVKCEGYNYTPFSYEDSYINQCIDEGLSEKEIINKLLREPVYSKEVIDELLSQELKKIRFQESQTDVKISEYIINNYKNKRLFRNEAHPENELIYEYASQILHKIGINSEYATQEAPFFICSQHPIYKCTEEVLKLNWDVEKEELDLYTYQGFKKVTYQDFLSNYIESCRKIKSLKERALLP